MFERCIKRIIPKESNAKKIISRRHLETTEYASEWMSNTVHKNEYFMNLGNQSLVSQVFEQDITTFLNESESFTHLADRLLLILVVEVFEQEITTFLYEIAFFVNLVIN